MSTATTKAAETKGATGGLESLGNDLANLLSAPASAPVSDGKPLDLPMDRVREDPEQPRQADNPGFTKESIAELGADIEVRGVKSPISVRDDPELGPGYYLINHGARRYRGTAWAKKATIPAFIDNVYSRPDQVIENLRREALTPREIADYIGREVAGGKKKIQIAAELSVSQAFVTQHAVLLELPDPIAEAFQSGRVRDVTVINELVKAYKKDPQKTTEWLSDEAQEMTRRATKMLRDWIDGVPDEGDDQSSRDSKKSGALTSQSGGETDAGEQAPTTQERPKRTKRQTDPDVLKKAIVQVMFNGQAGRLVLSRRPSVEGEAWVRYDDDGQEEQVPLASLKLVALVEGSS